MEVWYERTEHKWVHLFIHALGPIPTAWHLDVELHQLTLHWETTKDDFVGMFGLIGGIEALEKALQDIDSLVFDESRLHVDYGALAWDT